VADELSRVQAGRALRTVARAAAGVLGAGAQEAAGQAQRARAARGLVGAEHDWRITAPARVDTSAQTAPPCGCPVRLRSRLRSQPMIFGRSILSGSAPAIYAL